MLNLKGFSAGNGIYLERPKWVSELFRSIGFELVTLIKTHITSIDVDDEEAFYQLKQQLDILSCAVPDSIVDQVNTFVDKHLQPLALSPTSILGEMPTLETFFNYVSSTEDEFQEIVKNTIKPFILGRESYETQTYNKTSL